jgi:hypothetical protein
LLSKYLCAAEVLMVNTFLVDKNFRISASKLDDLRLGKQRVEAYQILITLTQLRFLARYFEIPDFPTGVDRPKSERDKWINQVISKFKQSGFIGMLIRGDTLIQYRHGETLPRKPASGNNLLYDSATGLVYEVKGKRQKVVASGPWHSFVLPGEELITTDFRKHPAVSMWLGFEEALKDYINAHIEVWISRGKNNTMKTYQVAPDYPRPAWSYSQDVIDNFKSALIEKEISRREDAWYLRQNDFIDVWASTKEYGDTVKQLMSKVPIRPPITDENIDLSPYRWYNYVNPQSLLSMGRFPGYIWP